MKFPISVFSISFIRLFCIAALFTNLILKSGCSITEIHHQIPPSPDAISGTKGLYLEKFKGKQSEVFSRILIHEINQLSSLKYFAFLPENGKKQVAIISAEVQSYKVNDQLNLLKQTHISLVEKELVKQNP